MKIAKTENDIYQEVVAYINGDKHNCPCVLATIKKGLRSSRIIDLIFSRPDIFKLEKEFKHVPEENLTEKILVKYVLAEPKYFSSLDETLQTLPVLVAFEFAKRRYEHISSLTWGPWAERLLATEKYNQCRDSISDMCDKIPFKYNDDDILKDYVSYVEKVSDGVVDFCKPLNKELKKEDKYIPKYGVVDFDIGDKRLFILVSGCPDSGKTTFSRILESKVNNSICFDSDMLLERNLLSVPLRELINDDAKVIIFSDLYANRFFTKEEFGDDLVINILIEPVSVEKMYRYSKYMQTIPFGQYKKHEIESYNYEDLTDAIHVTNNYDDRILKEVDVALEEISKKINHEQANNENCSNGSVVLKKTLM